MKLFAFFVVLTLGFGGEAFAVNSQKIEEDFQKINVEVQALERKMHENNLALYHAQKNLTDLTEREKTLRKKWVGDITHLNTALLQHIRLERLPKKPLYVMDVAHANEHRSNVVTLSQKNLREAIVGNKEELTTLMHNYSKKGQEIRKMESLKGEHIQQRRTLFEKQKEKINLMKLTNDKRAQMMEKAAKLANARTMDDVFAKSRLEQSLVPGGGSVHPGLPVMGKITRHFHQKAEGGIEDQGITIMTAPAADVQSLRDGRVIYNGLFREYGHLLIMEHADGLHTVYGGLVPDNTLQVGDFVTSGQFVGRMETVVEPKMYLEVRKAGQPINPVKILQ